MSAPAEWKGDMLGYLKDRMAGREAAHTPAEATAEGQIAKAQAVISDLCNRRRGWDMHIPARPNEDPDLVIGGALRVASQRISDLEADLAQRTKERDEAKAMLDDPLLHTPTELVEALRLAEARAAALEGALRDGIEVARPYWRHESDGNLTAWFRRVEALFASPIRDLLASRLDDAVRLLGEVRKLSWKYSGFESEQVPEEIMERIRAFLREAGEERKV